MSGESQQKKKHGNKAKRLGKPASASGRQGVSAGSAAAGHAAGARAGTDKGKSGGPGRDPMDNQGGVAESGGADGRATVPGGTGGGFDD